MSFHRFPKRFTAEVSSLMLISKPLYCCMDACRWHHYLPFSSWLEFSLLYSADQAGAYRHGILCASRRYSRYHHSIPGRSEFNSHRHGCVDIGIALIVLPSSKTIGELTSYIISLSKAMWHHSVRVVTWLV